MTNLHRQFINKKGQELLKKLVPNVDLLQLKEPLEDLPTELVIDKAEKVIADGDHLFSRYGFDRETRNHLVDHPILVNNRDEILSAIYIERDQIERSGLGYPRQGWESSPFEKFAQKSDFHKNLTEKKVHKDIAEFIFDDFLKKNAQKRLSEIQQKVSAAIEKVKNFSSKDKQKDDQSHSKANDVVKFISDEKEQPYLVDDSDIEKSKIKEDFGTFYSKDIKVTSQKHEDNLELEIEHKKAVEAQSISEKENLTSDLGPKLEAANSKPNTKTLLHKKSYPSRNVIISALRSSFGHSKKDEEICLEEEDKSI